MPINRMNVNQPLQLPGGGSSAAPSSNSGLGEGIAYGGAAVSRNIREAKALSHEKSMEGSRQKFLKEQQAASIADQAKANEAFLAKQQSYTESNMELLAKHRIEHERKSLQLSEAYGIANALRNGGSALMAADRITGMMDTIKGDPQGLSVINDMMSNLAKQMKREAREKLGANVVDFQGLMANMKSLPARLTSDPKVAPHIKTLIAALPSSGKSTPKVPPSKQYLDNDGDLYPSDSRNSPPPPLINGVFSYPEMPNDKALGKYASPTAANLPTIPNEQAQLLSLAELGLAMMPEGGGKFRDAVLSSVNSGSDKDTTESFNGLGGAGIELYGRRASLIASSFAAMSVGDTAGLAGSLAQVAEMVKSGDIPESQVESMNQLITSMASALDGLNSTEREQHRKVLGQAASFWSKQAFRARSQVTTGSISEKLVESYSADYSGKAEWQASMGAVAGLKAEYTDNVFIPAVAKAYLDSQHLTNAVLAGLDPQIIETQVEEYRQINTNPDLQNAVTKGYLEGVRSILNSVPDDPDSPRGRAIMAKNGLSKERVANMLRTIKPITISTPFDGAGANLEAVGTRALRGEIPWSEVGRSISSIGLPAPNDAGMADISEVIPDQKAAQAYSQRFGNLLQSYEPSDDLHMALQVLENSNLGGAGLEAGLAAVVDKVVPTPQAKLKTGVADITAQLSGVGSSVIEPPTAAPMGPPQEAPPQYSPYMENILQQGAKAPLLGYNEGDVSRGVYSSNYRSQAGKRISEMGRQMMADMSAASASAPASTTPALAQAPEKPSGPQRMGGRPQQGGSNMAQAKYG